MNLSTVPTGAKIGAAIVIVLIVGYIVWKSTQKPTVVSAKADEGPKTQPVCRKYPDLPKLVEDEADWVHVPQAIDRWGWSTTSPVEGLDTQGEPLRSYLIDMVIGFSKEYDVECEAPVLDVVKPDIIKYLKRAYRPRQWNVTVGSGNTCATAA